MPTVVFIEKNVHIKWTRKVQTHIVQGSTVLVLFNFLRLYSGNYTFCTHSHLRSVKKKKKIEGGGMTEIGFIRPGFRNLLMAAHLLFLSQPGFWEPIHLVR